MTTKRKGTAKSVPEIEPVKVEVPVPEDKRPIGIHTPKQAAENLTEKIALGLDGICITDLPETNGVFKLDTNTIEYPQAITDVKHIVQSGLLRFVLDRKCEILDYLAAQEDSE